MKTNACRAPRGGIRIIWEILLILVLSLVLALVHNVVSPTGIRILPKKAAGATQGSGGGSLHRTAYV